MSRARRALGCVLRVAVLVLVLVADPWAGVWSSKAGAATPGEPAAATGAPLSPVVSATPAGEEPGTGPPPSAAQLEPFGRCMEFVEWALDGGREVNAPDRSPPQGVDRDLWRRAIDDGNLNEGHWGDSTAFVHEPDCMLLWPAGAGLRDARWTQTELYQRCLHDVGNGSGIRPRGVPEWVWRNSMRTGSCYLLLPPDAFGLSTTSRYSRPLWHDWMPADQPTETEPADDRVAAAFDECRGFVDWRMKGGTASWDAPSWYEVPEGAAPLTVWRESLDYWKNRGTSFLDSFDFSKTTPGEWTPDCHLLISFTAQECGARDRAQSMLPEQCWGPVATARYDIGYERKDALDFGSDVWGTSTDYTYALGKGAIQVGLGIVDWALLDFEIERYDPIAVAMGDNFQDNLLGHPQFQLRHLLWLTLFSWAGYAALRGKVAMAGAEILISIVLLLLAGVLLDNRPEYMSATWDVMEKSADALLVAGMGQDPKEFEERCHGDECRSQRVMLVDQFQAQIHEVFVQRPYDYLNWGRALGSGDDAGNPMAPCAEARSSIIASGPHGTSEWPREQMERAGSACAELVTFNKVASGNRLLGAVMVAVSSFSIAILVALTALTLIVAKLLAVFLFGLAPFAAMAAILPGRGRRLAWSWSTALLQVVLVVVAISFILSLLLILLRNLFAIVDGAPVFEQFLIMNLAIFIVYATRRHLLRSSQAFASRLADYMSMTRGGPGGPPSWAAARSGNAGLDLLAIDRGTTPVLRGAAITAVAPVVLSAKSVQKRWVEQRMADRGYKNLQRLSYWKRRHNTEVKRWRQQKGFVDGKAAFAPRPMQDLP